jgi:hypothetical protein
MKSAVRKIDRALKNLYNLEMNYRAEEFLVEDDAPFLTTRVGSAEEGFRGALLVQSHPTRGLERGLSIGIYLNEPVKRELGNFPRAWRGQWSGAQLSAFAVAAEEVSHFNYLLFHAQGGRSLSQFELELQGEIDKFVLTFFARVQSGEKPPVIFESLFEQLFVRFRLAENLTEEQRDRYLEASNFAKSFVLRCQKYLGSPSGYERAFRLLRHFYRLNTSEKVSLISSIR